MQSDAAFVEFRPWRGFRDGFWDKFKIGFYKIERLLHTIRDFGDKRRGGGRPILLTLHKQNDPDSGRFRAASAAPPDPPDSDAPDRRPAVPDPLPT